MPVLSNAFWSHFVIGTDRTEFNDRQSVFQLIGRSPRHSASRLPPAGVAHAMRGLCASCMDSACSLAVGIRTAAGGDRRAHPTRGAGGGTRPGAGPACVHAAVRSVRKFTSSRDPRTPATDMTQGNRRTGGRVLVDALRVHGVDTVFCVPGESYLAALDALYDARDAIADHRLPARGRRHEHGGSLRQAHRAGPGWSWSRGVRAPATPRWGCIPRPRTRRPW